MSGFKSSNLLQDFSSFDDFLDPDLDEVRVTEFNEGVEIDLLLPEQGRVLLERKSTQDAVDVFHVLPLLGDVFATTSDVIGAGAFSRAVVSGACGIVLDSVVNLAADGLSTSGPPFVIRRFCSGRGYGSLVSFTLGSFGLTNQIETQCY